jgi:hypothetical protein
MGHGFTNGFSYYIDDALWSVEKKLSDARTVTLQFGRDLAIVEARLPRAGERVWQGSAGRALSDDVAEMMADWDGVTDEPGWLAKGTEENGTNGLGEHDRLHFVIRAAFRWPGDDVDSAAHETVNKIGSLLESTADWDTELVNRIAEVVAVRRPTERERKHACAHLDESDKPRLDLSKMPCALCAKYYYDGDDASLDDVRKRVEKVMDRYCITRPDRNALIDDVLGVVPVPPPERDLDECADCGASTAVGTPDPHECAPEAPADIFTNVLAAMQEAEEARRSRG